VVEEEAERVRTIFRRYLALGSLNRLMADLRVRGVVTKVRSLKTGRAVGGIPFTRGPLAHFLAASARLTCARLWCSRSWSSRDTCNRTEIRSVSVPMTRAPRCVSG